MVTVYVNGEERTYADAPTIAGLLGELGVRRDAVAVEVNREIVPRSRHDEHRLGDGDRLEVVTMVGGG